MKLLKRTVPIAVTGGFFVAALFLVAVVWNPASAETPNQDGIETSLLLTVDRPMAPGARDIRLDEENGEADATQPDLATELNSWTFTRGVEPPPHGHHPHPHPPPPPHPHPRPPHHHHHRTPHH